MSRDRSAVNVNFKIKNKLVNLTDVSDTMSFDSGFGVALRRPIMRRTSRLRPSRSPTHPYIHNILINRATFYKILRFGFSEKPS